MRAILLVLFMLAAVLFAAAAPAVSPACAAGNDDGITTIPEASAPVEKVGGMASRVSNLGVALIPLILIVAGIVMMFSGKVGNKLLVFGLIGAGILLGGWKLLVEIVMYVLGGGSK